MANPVRLFIARTADGDIAALSCSDKTQVTVDDDREYLNFLNDCLCINRDDVDSLDFGQTVACGMSQTNWKAWLKYFEVDAEQSDSVWLIISSDVGLQGSIVALEPITKREVLILSDHAAFKADVSYWDESCYQKQLSYVVRMDAEDWALWLEQWEALATVEAA